MLIPDNISDFNSIGEKILYLKFKNDKSGRSNTFYVRNRHGIRLKSTKKQG